MEREFSVRLKHVRESSGVTQAEFAKTLGVTRQTLGNYETGDRTPDIVFLKRLCQITGKSPRYFLSLQDAETDENAPFVNATNIWDQSLETFKDFWEYADVYNYLFTTEFFWNFIRRLDRMMKKYRENPYERDELWEYESYKCSKELTCFLNALHESEWNRFVKEKSKKNSEK